MPKSPTVSKAFQCSSGTPTKVSTWPRSPHARATAGSGKSAILGCERRAPERGNGLRSTQAHQVLSPKRPQMQRSQSQQRGHQLYNKIASIRLGPGQAKLNFTSNLPPSVLGRGRPSPGTKSWSRKPLREHEPGGLARDTKHVPGGLPRHTNREAYPGTKIMFPEASPGT